MVRDPWVLQSFADMKSSQDFKTRRTTIARSNYYYYYASGLTAMSLSWLLPGSRLCNTAVLWSVLIPGSLLPCQLFTLLFLFFGGGTETLDLYCTKNLKNKRSHWYEEMPCVLSLSLRLRDWLHLFPSNLALSSSKYDKLSAEPIICVWLLLSLALSQPCPAELLDHLCPPYGSTKVRAIISGGILSQQNKEFEELLAVATLCFGKTTV